MIPIDIIKSTAYELMAKAAIEIPEDYPDRAEGGSRQRGWRPVILRASCHA